MVGAHGGRTPGADHSPSTGLSTRWGCQGQPQPGFRRALPPGGARTIHGLGSGTEYSGTLSIVTMAEP